MIDPDKLRALAARLEAPSYWISGSNEGHDGENDAPREAAAAILAMAEREKRMREALERAGMRFDMLAPLVIEGNSKLAVTKWANEARAAALGEEKAS